MVMPINKSGMRRGWGVRPGKAQTQGWGVNDPRNPNWFKNNSADTAQTFGQPPNMTQPQIAPMRGRVGGMPNPQTFRPGLPKPDFSKLRGRRFGGMLGGGMSVGMPMDRGFKPAVMPRQPGMMRGRRFGAGGGMGTPPGTGGQPGMPGQPGMGAVDNGGLRRRLFARIQAKRQQRAAGIQAPQAAPIAPTEPITNG